MPDERWTDVPDDGVSDDIPPYLRKPPAGTIQAGHFWLSCINTKLRKLEALGLRPHATLLENMAAMERCASGDGLGEPLPGTMSRQVCSWH